MTSEAQRLRQAAIDQMPKPDIRIRTGLNESRELTTSELQAIGGGLQAMADELSIVIGQDECEIGRITLNGETSAIIGE